MKNRILVVEDEGTLRRVICEVLREDGHEVVAAPSAEEGLRLFREEPFPLVITDIVLGKMTGLELLKIVKDENPESFVVIMTSHASIDTAVESLRSGAYDFLIKPFEDIQLILAVVNRAMAQIDLIRRNLDLVKRLEQKASELESLNALLVKEANRDGLTGLYNHRYFREALDIELARASRYNATFAVLFVDIDDFKSFNDSHGHLAGDLALKSVANSLNRESRKSTVVARYGADQFIVLVPEIDVDGAKSYAQRLCQRVAGKPVEDESGNSLGQLTISAGVACFPGNGTEANTLVGCADKALRHAKKAGCNSVRSDDDIMNGNRALAG